MWNSEVVLHLKKILNNVERLIRTVWKDALFKLES